MFYELEPLNLYVQWMLLQERLRKNSLENMQTRKGLMKHASRTNYDIENHIYEKR
jgi:hypothetical protein